MLWLSIYEHEGADNDSLIKEYLYIPLELDTRNWKLLALPH